MLNLVFPRKACFSAAGAAVSRVCHRGGIVHRAASGIGAEPGLLGTESRMCYSGRSGEARSHTECPCSARKLACRLRIGGMRQIKSDAAAFEQNCGLVSAGQPTSVEAELADACGQFSKTNQAFHVHLEALKAAFDKVEGVWQAERASQTEIVQEASRDVG